jgi:hypothetical protein
MQKVIVQPPRQALAAAHVRLFSTARRALDRGTLPPEQIVRARRALKAGRSRRCSDEAIECAAWRCNLLARDIERGFGSKAPLPPRSAHTQVVP